MGWYRKPGKAHRDANQTSIVLDLRRFGLAVWEINDAIDLLVSDRRPPFEMWLVEVKNRDGDPRIRSKHQKEFLQNWEGKPVIIGYCSEDILRAIGRLK